MSGDVCLFGKHFGLLLSAWLLAAPAAADAQTPVPSGPLTLEQVLEIAESRSETIAAARAGGSPAQ